MCIVVFGIKSIGVCFRCGIHRMFKLYFVNECCVTNCIYLNMVSSLRNDCGYSVTLKKTWIFWYPPEFYLKRVQKSPCVNKRHFCLHMEESLVSSHPCRKLHLQPLGNLYRESVDTCHMLYRVGPGTVTLGEIQWSSSRYFSQCVFECCYKHVWSVISPI